VQKFDKRQIFHLYGQTTKVSREMKIGTFLEVLK